MSKSWLLKKAIDKSGSGSYIKGGGAWIKK